MASDEVEMSVEQSSVDSSDSFDPSAAPSTGSRVNPDDDLTGSAATNQTSEGDTAESGASDALGSGSGGSNDGDLTTSMSSVTSSSMQSSSGQDDFEDMGGGEEGGEEEGALSSGELSDLQKEGEMPIEELLASYNYSLHHPFNPSTSAAHHDDAAAVYYPLGGPQPAEGAFGRSGGDLFSVREEEILSKQDLCLDKDDMASHYLMRRGELDAQDMSDSDLITIVDLKFPSAAMETGSAEHRLLPELSRPDVSSGSSSVLDTIDSSGLYPDDDSDDSEYLPESDDSWKKAGERRIGLQPRTPRVSRKRRLKREVAIDISSVGAKVVSIGPEYQAHIPDLVVRQKNMSVYDLDERLLWDPCRLPQADVEMYCRRVCRQPQGGADARLNTDVLKRASAVRDDEQALYLLLQCSYNLEEALRRRQMEVIPPSDPLSLWTSEERTAFINGLRLYGKDFFLIQQNKVRSRSVSELVQFYYLWKKTEQCSSMTANNKKKPSASSTAGDESPSPPEDQSSSQCGIHSLLYTDQKRSSSQSHDHASCDHRPITEDVLSLTAGHYPWQPHDHFSRSTADGDDGDFLSTARPNFGAISVTSGRVVTAYREPFGEPGMLPAGSYHESYQQRCQLMASPYHEPYAESAMPYAYPAAEPAGCGMPYYAQNHGTSVYPSASQAVTGFTDSAAVAYAARFYPLLDGEEAGAFASPLHDYAPPPPQHGVEAKRFKSADAVSPDAVANPGLSRLGGEVFPSPCGGGAVSDGTVRYVHHQRSGGVSSNTRLHQCASDGGGMATGAVETAELSPPTAMLAESVAGVQGGGVVVYSSFSACPSLQGVTTKMAAQ